MKDLEKIKRLAQNKSILIVEDEIEVLEELRDIFNLFFYIVDTAENGLEGLRKVKENDYDIIISDITMPKMDGVEMITEIKKLDKKTNVVVLSANEESGSLIPLINIGVEKFVLKPLEQEKLFEKIKQMLCTIDKEELLNAQRIELENLNKFLEGQNSKLIRLTTILEEIIFNDSINISNDLLPRKIFKDIYFDMEKTKFRNIMINTKILKNMQENFTKMFEEVNESNKFSSVLIGSLMSNLEKGNLDEVEKSKGYKVIIKELKEYSDSSVASNEILFKYEKEMIKKLDNISLILNEVNIDF